MVDCWFCVLCLFLILFVPWLFACVLVLCSFGCWCLFWFLCGLGFVCLMRVVGVWLSYCGFGVLLVWVLRLVLLLVGLVDLCLVCG